MSLDFLTGITLFLITFMAIAIFIPGMFTPFQSETVDLNSVAYRTSVILVEDPGWWSTDTDSGEEWEKNDTTRYGLKRVGLALDRDHANILNLSKIILFSNSTIINNTNLTTKLSLYRTIGGNDIPYGYNITLDKFDGTRLAVRGSSTPISGTDVVNMRRVVLAHTGYTAYFNGSNLTNGSAVFEGSMNKTQMNVSGSQDGDVVFEIGNFNVSDPDSEYEWINLTNSNFDNETLTAGTNYSLWMKANGTDSFVSSAPPITPLDRNDTLKFIINRTLFVAGNNTLELKFDNITFQEGAPIEYTDIFIPVYESAKLTVKVWSWG
ncbi:MAG: hypothetical protein SVM80_03780 [Halobacteriota archaeon]|nr:hypothetical protein [Halobacteriota archaeon]